MSDWWIFKGVEEPHDDIETRLPEPPSWRTFSKPRIEQRLGASERGKFLASDHEKDMINAALYLRRPLFVTGKPGSGKSSLAYAVARELQLGQVLCWPITSRVTLHDGLYQYDAIGRLQDASLAEKGLAEKLDIGQYFRLGPLGTALLPATRPRVLLIDEIDKGDIDLPNDLLNIFEEGEFLIPELARMAHRSGQTQAVAVMPYDGRDDADRVLIYGGRVRCTTFPFIVLTSNGERQFPPAFLRRCLQLDVLYPDEEKLRSIVKVHLGSEIFPQAEQLIQDFLVKRTRGDLATDQLLNAIYLITQSAVNVEGKDTLIDTLLKYLTNAD